MEKQYSTTTSEGVIAHFPVETPYGVIQAPVMIQRQRNDNSPHPVPMRTGSGSLMFALPGGGVHVPVVV
jgi:hypothetical protein